MRSIGNDRGAVRLVAVTRLVVPLAIVGVIGYDTFAIMSSRVTTENQAQDAAYAASQEWHSSTTHNIDLVYQAAVTSVAGDGDKVLTRGFTVDADGTVHLLLQSTAKTVVVKHIGPLRHLDVAVEHGDANSVN